MKSNLWILLVLLIGAGCTEQAPSEVQATSTTQESSELKPGQEGVNDPDSRANILQVALNSKDHTTLVAAVKAAEQTTALANNGPLTVFAPTNDAFAVLPEGTLDNLLKPENKMTLITIVQMHAAPGTYGVDQLRDGQSLFVASGHNVKVEVKDDGTYVHGAKILGSVEASNGIVHVVDKVFTP